MRYYPAAIGLGLVLAVTSSVGIARQEVRPTDPRAEVLIDEAAANLAAGDNDSAQGYYEAALAVDPASRNAILGLAAVARQNGLQGKAIKYYREVQELYPNDVAAIAGEGEALAERGAIEKAKVNLTRLENLCRSGCSEAKELAEAVQVADARQIVSAEAVKSKATVQETN